jgi:hypothetical protein
LIAGALAGTFVLAAGSSVLAQETRYPDKPTQITIRSEPIAHFDNRDPAQTRFGGVEFRGGLVLASDFRAFGGISAIHLDAQGTRLLAVTDKGAWLRARIVYRDGRPERVTDAEMAPVLGPDGKPLATRGWYDSESLADSGGRFYIGIERVQKIVRFNIARYGLAARGAPIPVPADFSSLTKNKSLECLAAPPKGVKLGGALIAVSEQSLDAAGNLRAYVLDGANVTRFAVKRGGEFDVSDCAILAPAGLLLLERRFSFATGLGVRIRRIALDAIKSGAVLDGPVLFEADLAQQIDNMEAMAVHRNAQGELLVTLVSDDNFSLLQRTLLLQFALVEK